MKIFKELYYYKFDTKHFATPHHYFTFIPYTILKQRKTWYHLVSFKYRYKHVNTITAFLILIASSSKPCSSTKTADKSSEDSEEISDGKKLIINPLTGDNFLSSTCETLLTNKFKISKFSIDILFIR